MRCFGRLFTTIDSEKGNARGTKTKDLGNELAARRLKQTNMKCLWPDYAAGGLKKI